MPEIVYTRPFLYRKQEQAIFTAKRWSLCEASTKSGKTVASIARIIEWGFIGNGIVKAKPGQHYWWVAPVSNQAAIAYSRVKQNLTAGSFIAKDSPTPHIFLPTGTVLDFKSADNPDSLYGEDVYGMIIDEASRARDDAWHACRSTLTATRGPAVCIGNVKGRRNWFYEWCRRVEAGQDPNAEFHRITWQDAVAAGVLDLDEIEDARRNLPEQVFRELYEAVASDDGANPFGEAHILACVALDADGALRTRPYESVPVAFGVDLGKNQDYTVVIGLDEFGRVCVFQRWTGVPWRETIQRIHAIVGEDIPALVDSTGLGDPVLEELQFEHGNFRGYNFSPASKQRLMEGLAVSIQGREISYPDGAIKSELLAFEFEPTRTGVRYSAPAGYHDDCVCSLALARNQWTETQPAATLMSYYSEAAQIQKTAEALQREIESEPDVGRAFARSLSSIEREARDFNELTELYNETVSKYAQAERNCRRCGEPVLGPSRISDGVFVWHQGCL